MTIATDIKPEGSYNAEQIALMRVTLSMACGKLGRDKVNNAIRVKLASIILDTTRTGERDPDVLAELALQRLSISSVASQMAKLN